jgi:hypothetical protein
MAISARNHRRGKITDLKLGDTNGPGNDSSRKQSDRISDYSAKCRRARAEERRHRCRGGQSNPGDDLEGMIISADFSRLSPARRNYGDVFADCGFQDPSFPQKNVTPADIRPGRESGCIVPIIGLVGAGCPPGRA